MKIKSKVLGLVMAIALSGIPSIVNAEETTDKIVLNFKEDKIGLSLSGGGLLGSYELGALQYLREQGIEITDFDSAIGTSVGSLVLCSVLSNGQDYTTDMMMNIQANDICVGKLNNSKCEKLNNYWDKVFIKKNDIGNITLMGKGLICGQLDTTPLRNMIKNNINENKVLNSGVEIGLCVTPSTNLLKPQLKSGNQLNGKLADWTIASSSCWPVFEAYKVDGKAWVDGGYKSCHNADFLINNFNCDKIVVIDLQSKERSTDPNMVHIVSSTDLGSFLDFSPEQIRANYNQGYNDCKTYFEGNVEIIK